MKIGIAGLNKYAGGILIFQDGKYKYISAYSINIATALLGSLGELLRVYLGLDSIETLKDSIDADLSLKAEKKLKTIEKSLPSSVSEGVQKYGVRCLPMFSKLSYLRKKKATLAVSELFDMFCHVRMHQYLYYVRSVSILTDQEFDVLHDQYDSLQKEYPKFSPQPEHDNHSDDPSLYPDMLRLVSNHLYDNREVIL